MMTGSATSAMIATLSGFGYPILVMGTLMVIGVGAAITVMLRQRAAENHRGGSQSNRP